MNEVIDLRPGGTHETYWDGDTIRTRRRRRRAWMQAHDARARKRHEDLELVIWVAVGLLVLFGASFAPGPLPS